MPLSETFNVANPADVGRAPKLIGQDMREFKRAVAERLGNGDHYFPASGDTYDDDASLEHVQVTLRVGAAPAAVADKAMIYSKDEDGKAEAFVRGEDGYETLLSLKSFTFAIEKGVGWNSLAIPIFRAPRGSAIQIIQAEFAVIGTGTPTLTFNIEERAATTLNNAGTDICAADQVAVAAGLSVTSFSNASIAAKACLVFTTAAASAESGTVTLITGTIYYR
jgi:hypothetical protein